MIKYSDNPNLGGKIVKTVTGIPEYKSNCKKIKGEYHILGVDCHFIDNTWYRVNSGMIVFNHSTGQWVLKSKAKDLINGVVGFENLHTPIYGMFTKDPGRNLSVTDAKTGDSYTIMDALVAPDRLTEVISSGKFYINASNATIKEASRIRNLVDNKQKGYNIEDNEVEFANKVNYFNNLNLKINRNVQKYSKLLGDITFGFEMECIRGYLPEHIQYQTGTVVCRDGSLHDEDGTQGPEFTTIPMGGSKGVQAIINLCNALKNRTNIDKNCSMHVHIGNIPTSRLFLVSLYKLGMMVQDELFSLFPYYKNDERQLAGKDKNYCQKLKRLQPSNANLSCKDSYLSYINDGYFRIFNFLSGNRTFPDKSYNRTNRNHPKQHKWERSSRYYWLNLMNTIFSSRNTVEFRLHNGTTNAQKAITWLFICNALIKTASSQAGNILKGKKFTLNDVIAYYLTFKTEAGTDMYVYLKEYISKRKQYFLNDFSRNDVMSLNELSEDKDFYYDINGVSNMFQY